jgi:hypothetical protein
MGQTFTFLDSEQKQWNEHNLQFDGEVRAANLKILKNIPDGVQLFLAFTKNKWGNLEYQHYFVTDKKHFIEFGSASLDPYKARVNINTQPRDYTTVEKVTSEMNQEIRDRINHVLGMRNYSLCLRNCEHVANYIIRRKWVSSQMDEESGVIFSWFKNSLLGNTKRMVNTFPSDIRPHVFKSGTQFEKIYSFINDHFVPSNFSYYLDSNEDTYNILLIGPTGAGKSHLINLFFNQKVCESSVSHESVTREIYFVRGRGEVYDIAKKDFIFKDICIADTIGLCDTEWDDNQIVQMIKSRISSNCKYIDAVYIVYRADRLLKEHVSNIKKVLMWLNYGKAEKSHLRFNFVGTFADYLSDNEKDRLRNEARLMLGIKKDDNLTRHFIGDTKVSFKQMIYVGFPPEEAIIGNELQTARVKESWKQLTLINSGITDRIAIPTDNGCNIL